MARNLELGGARGDGSGVDGGNLHSMDGFDVDGGNIHSMDGSGVDGGNLHSMDGSGVDGAEVVASGQGELAKEATPMAKETGSSSSSGAATVAPDAKRARLELKPSPGLCWASSSLLDHCNTKYLEELD